MLEQDSSIPNRRYGDGLRRLGFDAGVTAFYDEHVLVDAVHEPPMPWTIGTGARQPGCGVPRVQ